MRAAVIRSRLFLLQRFRPRLSRPRLFRPPLLRAVARLAIAVFCVQAAQPLAAAVRAAHAPPATLAICTAAGPKVLDGDGESAPGQRDAAADQTCVFCCAGIDATPPRARRTPSAGHAASPRPALALARPVGEHPRCPDARGPPAAGPG